MWRYIVTGMIAVALTMAGCDSTPPSIVVSAEPPPVIVPEESPEPVTGVSPTPIYESSALLHRTASLPAGLPVTLTAEQNDRVRLETEAGDEGWVLRCYLCTKKEYERRQNANEVPVEVTYICSQRDGKAIYRADLAGLTPGQAVGVEPFAGALTIYIDSREFEGDYNSLLLVRENFRVKKLPIWPWSEKVADASSG